MRIAERSTRVSRIPFSERIAKMKRWKKLSFLWLIVVLISQIPFAYRRYLLGRLNARIQVLNSERTAATNSNFAEYKGVAHVHSFLGGHSTGNFSEIVSAAQANQLQFVIMTEHPAKDFNTAELTLKGIHGGVLFVNGNEVSAANGDRLLLMPGDATPADAENRTTNEIATKANARGSLVVVAYPEQFKDWTTTDFIGGYDGVEVYNVYTNARQINQVIAFCDTLWSHHSYPDLLFQHSISGQTTLWLNGTRRLLTSDSQQLPATTRTQTLA